MEDRFILDDQLNAVLGYGELSLLFLRLYYQVRATIPDAIIRGNVGKLIGVSRPNQRFLFYALKEEVSYSIKFSSGEKLDFNTDNDALYRTLVDQQVQRMNESPEAFSIGASVTAAKKDNSYQDIPDSMRQDDSDRDDPLFMEFHANPEEYHDIEIAQLPVSNRVINHLKGMGIHTFADLLLLKRDEVRRIPQLGEKSIGEILSMIPRVINGSVELSPGDAIRKQNERTERELLNKQKRAACGESILQACSMQQSSEVTIIACVAFRDFVKEWIKQQADRIKNERDREIALRVLIEEQSLAVVGYDYNVTRERNYIL